MSEYIIQIGNEVREMNDEEIAQREKDIAESKTRSKIIADRKELKLATIAKLGLTAEELSALIS